jgi:hypothetical protein
MGNTFYDDRFATVWEQSDALEGEFLNVIPTRVCLSGQSAWRQYPRSLSRL